MRVGPSRLISTAPSRGASKATVAAEWMTMSHVASTPRSSSSRPRPSVPTSPVMTCTRRAVISAKRLAAQVGAEAIEGVVLQHLALDALRRGRPLAGPHEQDHLAVGGRSQQSLHERGADEAGRSGHGDALAGEGFGDHATLPTTFVYHVVSGPPDPPTVGNVRAHPGRRAPRLRHPGLRGHLPRRLGRRARAHQADHPVLVRLQGRRAAGRRRAHGRPAGGHHRSRRGAQRQRLRPGGSRAHRGVPARCASTRRCWACCAS